MKVTLYTIKDYANVMARMARSLNAVGVNARSFCKEEHPFNYPNPAELITVNNETAIYDWIAGSDVLIYGHSFQTRLKREPEKTVVFHGGTLYRENMDEMNDYFDFVDLTLYQTYELANDGMVNPVQYIPGIDTELIQPMYVDDLIFAHFPSSPKTKGSALIKEVMAQFDVPFLYDDNPVSFAENLDRMRACSVYIEKQSYYYGWSLTALEAAALGKMVITDAGEFDEPFYICESPEVLTHFIRQLCEDVPLPQYYQTKQRQTRRWVEQKYSLPARGAILKQHLEAL